MYDYFFSKNLCSPWATQTVRRRRPEDVSEVVEEFDRWAQRLSCWTNPNNQRNAVLAQWKHNIRSEVEDQSIPSRLPAMQNVIRCFVYFCYWSRHNQYRWRLNQDGWKSYKLLQSSLYDRIRNPLRTTGYDLIPPYYVRVGSITKNRAECCC